MNTSMFLNRALGLAAPVLLLSVWVPLVPAGLDLYMPVPESNLLTPGKVSLGRRLFFDPILSRDLSVACATCHDPRRAFSDGLPRAVGVDGRINARHAPALLNRGYGRAFFWDGRAASLEDQVLQPIESPDELGHSIDAVMVRLRGHAEYRALFRTVFDREPHPEDLARALASYVRTILAGDAPIDRYFSGEPGALTGEQREGLEVFRGKGRCAWCHSGPTFTDERFHNTGVAWQDGRLVDPGRAAVTLDERDRGAFKTPTLREVARTAPYMHDGSLKTLEEVVERYSAGGRSNPSLDPDIRPIPFTPAEKRSLVAFLGALSGTITEGRLVQPGQRPILFDSDRTGRNEIFALDVASSAPPRQLTHTVGARASSSFASWSPDGQRIVFVVTVDGNADIAVMAADGSDVKRLTTDPGSDLYPTWSPDGRRIAYVSDRDGNREIYVMGADGGEPRNLTHHSAFDSRPSWSADGMSILFGSDRDQGGRPTPGVRRLTNHPRSDMVARFSPDGRDIVFASNRDGNQQVYRMKADGSLVRRLTNTPATNGGPAWSTDGQWIVFNSERDGNSEIYIMRADGSDVRRLTTDPASDVHPFW